MNGLLFKDGVLPIDMIAKAGARILGALDVTARHLVTDLMVTCADKDHPADDPHSLGEAYDVRTHGMDDEQKSTLLMSVVSALADQDDPTDIVLETSGGLATRQFFGWIEHAGEPDEHLHVQRRKGVVYA